MRSLWRDPNFRAIASSTFASSVGNGLFAATSFLYYTHVLAIPPVSVSTVLTGSGVVAMLTGVPTGRLLDRTSPAVANSILLIFQAVAIGLLALFSKPLPLFLAIALATLLSKAKLGARGALIAIAFQGPNRVLARSGLRALNNGGMAVGSGLAAAVTSTNRHWEYALTMLVVSASYVLAALLLFRNRIARARVLAPTDAPDNGRSAVRDPRYVLLTLLTGLFSMHYLLIEIGIPLWISCGAHRPLWLVSAGLVINTLIVAFCQMPLGRFIRDTASAIRATILASVLIGTSCIVIAIAGTLPSYCIDISMLFSFVAYSIGEVLQSSAAWELSYELADPSRHGEYQGLFSSGVTMGTIVAPTTFGIAISFAGDLGWFLIGGSFAIIGIGHKLLSKLNKVDRAVPVRTN